MKNNMVFVVDDESFVRVTLADDLRDMGYKVLEFNNPLLALMDIPKFNPDIIFTDIRMPELNGIEFLKQVKTTNPNIYVIVMTGYSSVATAVEAVKSGAYDYLSKPINIEDVKIIVNQINEILTLKQDYSTLIDQTSSNFSLSTIIGSSTSTQNVIESIKSISGSNTTILIQGETGTGKELVANVIHYNSLRKEKPLIKVSCAILSKEIIESELFGHEKGAFTGAIKDKKGRFELADNGTLYLDDIDDIPMDLQVKLLRVLEESEFERVGGERTFKINVRIIASTKKDLRNLIKEGKFREDLFYRLNVFPIFLKPLRERKDDIEDLLEYFLKRLEPTGKFSLNYEVIETLRNYNWPGNVRELKHMVERLIITAKENEIRLSQLPNEVFQSSYNYEQFSSDSHSLDEFLNNIELNILQQTLQKTNGNKSKAAELLRIPYSTLRTKLDKFDLQ